MYGALMLATDRRPKFTVFMTPTTTFRAWFDLDTKRPAVVVQFAAHDEYVSAKKAMAFAVSLPPLGRTVRTYRTGQARAIERATNDRRS